MGMALCTHTHLFSPHSQKTRELLFHTAKVMAIAWSPNSAYIVSGSIDTNIIVWTAATGERDEIRGVCVCVTPSYCVSYYSVPIPYQEPILCQ